MNTFKKAANPKKIKYTRKVIEQPICALWEELMIFNPNEVFEYKKEVKVEE